MAKRRSQLLDILYSSGPAAAVLQAASKNRDRGLTSELRYPFLAIVGQQEMKFPSNHFLCFLVYNHLV